MQLLRVCWVFSGTVLAAQKTSLRGGKRSLTPGDIMRPQSCYAQASWVFELFSLKRHEDTGLSWIESGNAGIIVVSTLFFSK